MSKFLALGILLGVVGMFSMQAQTKSISKNNEYVTLALKKIETSIKDIYDEIGAEQHDLNFEAF